jgi:hypothetical protein
MLSKEALFFINQCWINGDRRVIILSLDESFQINQESKKSKITKELISEIEESGRVKMWDGGKNTYNLMGLVGRDKK